MSFNPQTNVDLAGLTTFKIGGKARYFAEINNTEGLYEAFDWLETNGLPHIILSGGSNTIFDDGIYEGLIIKISIQGFEIIKQDSKQATIRVGSGEDWDETVSRCVDMNLSGMEALSGIPGKTGAAPVQNIGAYGQEIKNSIDSVEVFDLKDKLIKNISAAECKFGYRDSIFKSSQKGRYVITYVNFRLSKLPAKIPNYNDVINYFNSRDIKKPSLKQIREAILDIRKNKFINPVDMPNAGSFFKNPVVNEKTYKKIIKLHPDTKIYPEDTKIFPTEDGNYKIAAGWLIDQCGLKGLELDKVRVDPKHALVLENKGGASKKDLDLLINKIIDKVRSRYSINLEPEPVVFSFKNQK